MKAYTDLEQSKRLAEILPPESADMCYIAHSELINIYEPFYKKIDKEDTPCWSLAALLEIVANVAARIDEDGYVDAVVCKDVHSVSLINCNGEQGETDNLVDACVEMIMRLHELNLL